MNNIEIEIMWELIKSLDKKSELVSKVEFADFDINKLEEFIMCGDHWEVLDDNSNARIRRTLETLKKVKMFLYEEIKSDILNTAEKLKAQKKS